jgi:cell wall-associated NlpC family hydrolase
VPNPTPGRHRAPGAPSPVSALSSALSRSAKPIGKVSAALAVSGGLVASFSLPASASPLSKQARPAVAPAAAAPAAAATPALDAVAVSTAASSRAAVVSPTFGEIGFTGVVKPKPKPKPQPAPEPVVLAESVANVERAVAQPSRSMHRSRLGGTSSSPRHHASSHRASSAPAPQRRHVAAPAPQAPSAPASAGVLGTAASLAGISYVYGGTTPSGFDCSGYTQYVFAKAGRSLPRTAEAQRAAATPVSNPQPGDLVFFGAPAFHVGIYAGNGTMWDSPRTGKTTGKHSIWSSNVSYGRP